MGAPVATPVTQVAMARLNQTTTSLEPSGAATVAAAPEAPAEYPMCPATTVTTVRPAAEWQAAREGEAGAQPPNRHRFRPTWGAAAAEEEEAGASREGEAAEAALEPMTHLLAIVPDHNRATTLEEEGERAGLLWHPQAPT